MLSSSVTLMLIVIQTPQGVMWCFLRTGDSGSQCAGKGQRVVNILNCIKGYSLELGDTDTKE